MTLSKTVQETQNDANDVTPNSTAGVNYWGYATLNYFALDRRYSSERSPGPTREFKAMVKALHDLAVEVFIDEVYNRTGEGEAWNSADKTIYNLYSFRGLDNRTYYSLTADMQFSWDNTGVGGNFNTYNTIAQDLIVDLLAYWRDAIGIDGFRFDLASALGNTRQDGCFNFDKLDPNNALNRIVRELRPRPATDGEGVDLIAEPWAIGGNSYQVGGFPAGWSEWNGLYRDNLREAQNELGVIPVSIATLATRFQVRPTVTRVTVAHPGTPSTSWWRMTVSPRRHFQRKRAPPLSSAHDLSKQHSTHRAWQPEHTRMKGSLHARAQYK